MTIIKTALIIGTLFISTANAAAKDTNIDANQGIETLSQQLKDLSTEHNKKISYMNENAYYDSDIKKENKIFSTKSSNLRNQINELNNYLIKNIKTTDDWLKIRTKVSKHRFNRQSMWLKKYLDKKMGGFVKICGVDPYSLKSYTLKSTGYKLQKKSTSTPNCNLVVAGFSRNIAPYLTKFTRSIDKQIIKNSIYDTEPYSLKNENGSILVLANILMPQLKKHINMDVEFYKYILSKSTKGKGYSKRVSSLSNIYMSVLVRALTIKIEEIIQYYDDTKCCIAAKIDGLDKKTAIKYKETFEENMVELKAILSIIKISNPKAMLESMSKDGILYLDLLYDRKIDGVHRLVKEPTPLDLSDIVDNISLLFE